MTLFTLESQRLRIVVFLKGCSWKDTKFQGRMAREPTIGPTLMSVLRLTFMLESTDSMTVIASPETSLSSIRSSWISQSSRLRTTFCTQEWCLIWSRFLQILRRLRSILRSSSREGSQIKSWTSILLMTGKFYRLRLCGMTLLMMEVRKLTLWTTFWATAPLRSKKLKLLTLVLIHSQCC